MKLFTPKQIEELLEIVDKHHSLFIGINVGTNYLTQHERQVLKDAGIDIEKFDGKRGKIDEAFTFGILSSAIGDRRVKGMDYKEFKKFVQSKNFMPLTTREEAAIEHLKYQTYSDTKKLANKVKGDISEIIINEDKSFSTKMFDDAVRDAATKVIELRGSVRDMVSEIGHKTGEWDKNLGRIAEYTLHNAYEEGRAAQLEREYGGEEVYVYKDVYAGACKHCIKGYLTNGIGSQPRIFKLSELRANGTNIGRKTEEWLPTLGPLHPYCRCTVNELPKGYVWDEKEGRFVMGKKEIKNERVRNRQKISIKIGDQEYLV